MTEPLKLLVFDSTQLLRKPLGLGLSWRVGTVLYRGLGRVHAALGASDWASALDWLERYQPDRPIAEIQYWGHGRWGRALIDRDSLDRSALQPGHRLLPRLEALRARLAPDALLWFRTCETSGGRAGQDFVSALADFTGATVAGHTYEIAFFQSGLRVLSPGMSPSWSAAEGIARGTPEAPERALSSHPQAPNTITCLTGVIPHEMRSFTPLVEKK